jgi:hypothetical protein
VRIATAVLAVVTALALAGCGEDEESTTEATISSEEKIEQTGNEWAALFAGGERYCGLMTQGACERVTCESNAGPIENCTPPSSGFRKSFRDATVQDIAIKGDHAGAKFSNGESVELVEVPDPQTLTVPGEPPDTVWWIDKLGGNAGRELFE